MQSACRVQTRSVSAMMLSRRQALSTTASFVSALAGGALVHWRAERALAGTAGALTVELYWACVNSIAPSIAVISAKRQAK
jgi:hypothetical protein